MILLMSEEEQEEKIAEMCLRFRQRLQGPVPDAPPVTLLAMGYASAVKDLAPELVSDPARLVQLLLKFVEQRQSLN